VKTYLQRVLGILGLGLGLLGVRNSMTFICWCTSSFALCSFVGVDRAGVFGVKQFDRARDKTHIHSTFAEQVSALEWSHEKSFGSTASSRSDIGSQLQMQKIVVFSRVHQWFWYPGNHHRARIDRFYSRGKVVWKSGAFRRSSSKKLLSDLTVGERFDL